MLYHPARASERLVLFLENLFLFEALIEYAFELLSFELKVLLSAFSFLLAALEAAQIKHPF